MCDQVSSAVIKVHHLSSSFIFCDQVSSYVIRCHPMLSGVIIWWANNIKCHHLWSSIMKYNQMWTCDVTYHLVWCLITYDKVLKFMSSHLNTTWSQMMTLDHIWWHLITDDETRFTDDDPRSWMMTLHPIWLLCDVNW